MCCVFSSTFCSFLYFHIDIACGFYRLYQASVPAGVALPLSETTTTAVVQPTRWPVWSWQSCWYGGRVRILYSWRCCLQFWWQYTPQPSPKTGRILKPLLDTPRSRQLLFSTTFLETAAQFLRPPPSTLLRRPPESIALKFTATVTRWSRWQRHLPWSMVLLRPQGHTTNHSGMGSMWKKILKIVDLERNGTVSTNIYNSFPDHLVLLTFHVWKSSS